MRYYIYLGIFVVGMFFFTVPLHAADVSGLSVSPNAFELTVDTGTVVSNTIRLHNDSAKLIKVFLQTQPIDMLDYSSQIYVSPTSSLKSAADWVTFENAYVDVPAHKTAYVPFQMNVKQSETGGTHYGAIVFTYELANKLQTSIGSVLLVNIPHTGYEQMILTSLDIPEQLFTFSNLHLNLELKNQGNIYEKPQGTVTVNSLFGKQVKQYQLPAKTIFSGKYAAYDLALPFYHIGLYQVVVSIRYSARKIPLETNTYIFTGGGYLIIALVLLFFILVARHNRRGSPKKTI